MRPFAHARFADLQYYCNTDAMGTPITVTRRGVITLPARLRRALGLRAEDQLIAELTADGLLLRPAVTLPVEIYTAEREREFDAAEADLAAVLRAERRSRPVARARRRSPPRGR
jgi:AbrB family looped-hinge helix DNA binding protein